LQLKQSLYLLIGILLAWSPAQAQDDEDLIINEISFTGYKKMNLDFLYDRLVCVKGAALTDKSLGIDKQRINRLNGVLHSSVTLDTLANNKVNMTFEIQEQTSLKPNIGLGSLKDNFFWQIGASEYNFKGLNQTLAAYYLSQDGRPNGKIYYENPNVKGGQWGYSVQAFHTASIEPFQFGDQFVSFNYDLSGLGLTRINHMGFYNRLTYSATYFREKHEKADRNPDLETPGPALQSFDKLLFTLGFVHDRVDYFFFYRTGFTHQLLGQNVTTFDDDAKFWSFTYEGRHYWRIGKTNNVAAQVRLGLSTNNDSPFAPFVLDSNFNLRGVGFRVDRATAQFIVNLETRQTIVHKERWGLQLVAFSDSGTWRAPGTEFNEIFKSRNFRSFTGLGARLIAIKVFDAIVRIDYGIDVFDSDVRGLVLGLGQYF